MRTAQGSLTVETSGRGLIELTDRVDGWLGEQGVETGVLHIFCRHTSASVFINENAAAAVQRDLLAWLDRVAPESDVYHHDSEGPDDMPAHLKTLLTGSSLNVPVSDGRMLLGTWQGIFLAEHRRQPHTRRIVLTVIGA